MANDIRDKDLPPVEANAGQELVQKLAGGADEGLALQILVIARGLAKEEDAGVGAPVAGDRLARAPMERARGAGANLSRDQLEVRPRRILHGADYGPREPVFGPGGALRAKYTTSV